MRFQEIRLGFQGFSLQVYPHALSGAAGEPVDTEGQEGGCGEQRWIPEGPQRQTSAPKHLEPQTSVFHIFLFCVSGRVLCY